MVNVAVQEGKYLGLSRVVRVAGILEQLKAKGLTGRICLTVRADEELLKILHVRR